MKSDMEWYFRPRSLEERAFDEKFFQLKKESGLRFGEVTEAQREAWVQEAREYAAQYILYITSVEPISDYKLKITYETGEIKYVDVSPYIKGGWYGELSNPEYFRAVQVRPDRRGLSWPNGQDIAPHELYNIEIKSDDDKDL